MADLALSILDLAPVREGQTAAESFSASVALARLAEDAGYQRVWYAEHHNMPSIASSATSVLIAPNSEARLRSAELVAIEMIR
jgi:alkanesulfonate monooxygenase SsuD/methylene tetrahydromethanopterin reductase-like flavin-dependent oxidoreductase (luciferase family)